MKYPVPSYIKTNKRLALIVSLVVSINCALVFSFCINRLKVDNSKSKDEIRKPNYEDIPKDLIFTKLEPHDQPN